MKNGETYSRRILVLALLLGVALMARTARAGTKTVEVNCGKGGTIADALAKAAPGEPLVIVVFGTCSENVTITRDDVTLQGGPSGGGVNGPNLALDTILIDGARRAVIDTLVVTGGWNGVAGARGAAFQVRNSTIQNTHNIGIIVRQNSQAVIQGNIVESNPSYGIHVVANSNATIVGNTVRLNPGWGIGVEEASNARIGFTDAGTADGNTIVDNDLDGIVVFLTSSAILYGNTIRYNAKTSGYVGISAYVQSAIRMLGRNTVDSNNGAGVFLRSSSLRTGRGDFLITPNDDHISNNAGPGISAEENSDVDLRDGLTVTHNTGFGIFLQHGSRTRMRNTTVSGNAGGGIHLQLASSVRFLGSGNSIPGNGGFGLLCEDGESSYTGSFTGGGNSLGDVNSGCTGF